MEDKDFICALEDAEEVVRCEALRVLEEHGGTIGMEVVQVLRKVASEDPSPDIRFVARRVLANRNSRIRVREDPQARERNLQQTLENLSSILDRANPEQRILVLRRIAESGDRRFGDPLVARLELEPDDIVLAHLVTMIGRLGCGSHAPAVQRYIRHKDPRVAANAVEALLALTNETSVETLLPLLVREDLRLKANLMVGLYERFPIQVMGFVRRMLRSNRFSARASGLYCARHVDIDDIRADVQELIGKEDNPEVLAAAKKWIADLGETAASPAGGSPAEEETPRPGGRPRKTAVYSVREELSPDGTVDPLSQTASYPVPVRRVRPHARTRKLDASELETGAGGGLRGRLSDPRVGIGLAGIIVLVLGGVVTLRAREDAAQARTRIARSRQATSGGPEEIAVRVHGVDPTGTFVHVHHWGHRLTVKVPENFRESFRGSLERGTRVILVKPERERRPEHEFDGPAAWLAVEAIRIVPES